MKKLTTVLACMLACLVLLSGCTDKKDINNQNLPNSVEIDDTDMEIDAAGKPDTETTLPDGFTYSFKDPENSAGIVVTPRE